MKNIFLAIDFTPASTNAALYAAKLAKHYKATIHLFHAWEVRKDISYITNTEHPSHELKQWLRAEAELICKEGNIQPEISAEEGFAPETILKNAIDKKADVIICAMKDSKKGFNRIFGSTTISLINKSDIPLLIIPEHVSFKDPSHIALAIDMDPLTSPITIELIKNMGEKFKPKLSVFYALTENFNENEITKFHAPANLSEVKHLSPRYEFRVGNDIAKALNEFANENAVDMLAIISHKHNWLERWTTESITKNLVFTTKLPLLVLPQMIKGIDDVKMNLEKLGNIWKEVKNNRVKCDKSCCTSNHGTCMRVHEH